MPNCIEYFLAYWAIVRAGGVVAAVNTRLGPDEMAYVLADSTASILITHERAWDAVSAGLEQPPSIENTVIAGGE